jgi:hypothetical protein
MTVTRPVGTTGTGTTTTGAAIQNGCVMGIAGLAARGSPTGWTEAG